MEAARAGEAGASFAVVADEVRNLAVRASDAAKNTEEMIDDTVGKVNAGSDLVRNTNDAFTKVAESSTRVGSLIDEIAEASNEQAQGIEQVNNSVNEIDVVIRHNSDNAMASARSSDGMIEQARIMSIFVDELGGMVGGAGDVGKAVQGGESQPEI